MNSERILTCILCPIGCKILVKTNGMNFKIIKGNKCERGIDYSRNEILYPRRILTTSVLVKNGEWPLVSVRSSKPILKKYLLNILNETKRMIVKAPVKSGQIIIKNVEDTGINIIATKTVKKSSSQ